MAFKRYNRKGYKMLKIKSAIAQKIYEKVLLINAEAQISAQEIATMLEYPPDTTMGDLAFPCFKLSKVLRRSPVQIAAAIAEGLCGEEIESAEAVEKSYPDFWRDYDALLTKEG